MRTILNPGSQLSNPAEYFVSWSGKVEKVKNTKGEIEKEGGFFFWKDQDNDYAPVALSMPMILYPIGESMSITGGIYDASTKSGTFLSSNEFGGWDETITVYEKESGASSSDRIARGQWQDIKDTIKAHGGKIQTNLYVVAKIGDEPTIVRFQMKGAASMALSRFRKNQGKKFYEQALKWTGVEYKVNGSVDYAAPKFEAGDAYSDSDLKNLEGYAKIISEYGQALAARNAEAANQPVIVDDNGEEPAKDVVPTVEEVDKILADSEEVDLNNIPF